MAQGTLSFVAGMSRPVQTQLECIGDLASGDEADDEAQAGVQSASSDRGPLYRQRTICFAKATTRVQFLGTAAAAGVAVRRSGMNLETRAACTLQEPHPPFIAQPQHAALTASASPPEPPAISGSDDGHESAVNPVPAQSRGGLGRSRSRRRKTPSVTVSGGAVQLTAGIRHQSVPFAAEPDAAAADEEPAVPRERLRQRTIGFHPQTCGPVAAMSAVAGEEATTSEARSVPGLEAGAAPDANPCESAALLPGAATAAASPREPCLKQRTIRFATARLSHTESDPRAALSNTAAGMGVIGEPAGGAEPSNALTVAAVAEAAARAEAQCVPTEAAEVPGSRLEPRGVQGAAQSAATDCVGGPVSAAWHVQSALPIARGALTPAPAQLRSPVEVLLSLECLILH